MGGFGRISLGNTGNFTDDRSKDSSKYYVSPDLYLKWEVEVNFGGVLELVGEGDYTLEWEHLT